MEELPNHLRHDFIILRHPTFALHNVVSIISFIGISPNLIFFVKDFIVRNRTYLSNSIRVKSGFSSVLKVTEIDHFFPFLKPLGVKDISDFIFLFVVVALVFLHKL